MIKDIISDPIFGLVGPSGVGKGFYKEELKKLWPEHTEPIVVTTREKRKTDGADRIAGLGLDQFYEMVSNGKVIFEHQPFGLEGPWYGFLAESFITGRPILTEVHVDNVMRFRKTFQPGRLALLGLIANQEYLSSNLSDRATEGQFAREIRLAAALKEVEDIKNFRQIGVIDQLLVVTGENRDIAVSLIRTLALSLLSL